MKTYIIYASFHHRNTQKIAEVLADNLNAELDKFENFNYEKFKNADLIGFGSGVYFSKFHRGLLNLTKSLDKQDSKKAFIFSTAGMKKNFLFNRAHGHFKKILKKQGFNCLDEFSCLAYDTYGLLKIFGGVNKNRPNQKDLDETKNFALKLKN